jgi:4-amino-4-deoxy-L-arabinose transferase-like glycosyltransferase
MWYRFAIWFGKNKYLIPIFILAVILLVYHATYRTFWGDETAVLDYLKFSPIEFISAYWHKPDNHPPLYYFLVLLVSKVLSWNELTIRLISIISGLGIVVVVHRFMYRVTHNHKQAALAAFFTAFSSYFVLISQLARYHSLAALAALLVFYFFYQLFVEGYQKSIWYWYLATLVLVGYVDYPHFIYVVVITNVLYLYRLARHRPLTSFWRWVSGQLVAAALLIPVAFMLYNRIFIQGDGGFNNTNLLSNSWLHIIAGIAFHIYSFFFGENIFPWNYVVFGLGCLVFVGMVVGVIGVLRKKEWKLPQAFILVLSGALIVFNTLFMNVADPRYNFIVYPKFGFVAYSLWIMSFVLCLSALKSKKIKVILFVAWAAVEVVGLVNFYGLTNYLNASYFRTFASFEYVRNNSYQGQYLAITPAAGEGVYQFYQQKYFNNLTPLSWSDFQSSTIPKESEVWFFSVASDGNDESVTTQASIPQGYAIIREFDDVPLDPTFKKYKEKLFHRPSYTYKYSVFLLGKL